MRNAQRRVSTYGAEMVVVDQWFSPDLTVDKKWLSGFELFDIRLSSFHKLCSLVLCLYIFF